MPVMAIIATALSMRCSLIHPWDAATRAPMCGYLRAYSLQWRRTWANGEGNGLRLDSSPNRLRGSYTQSHQSWSTTQY